jgi:hypothetical protein
MVIVIGAIALFGWTFAVFSPAQIGAGVAWVAISLILYGGYRFGKLSGL